MDKNDNALRRMAALTAAMLFALSLLCSRVGGTCDGAINPGDRCADVYLVQSRLKELGYDTPDEPGCFSYGTLRALKRFQTDTGLPADGRANRATLSALGFESDSGCFALNVRLLAAVIQRDMGAAPYAEKLLYARRLVEEDGNGNKVFTCGQNDINLRALSDTSADSDSRSAAQMALLF